MALSRVINPYWSREGTEPRQARRAFFTMASPENIAAGAPEVGAEPMPGLVERVLLFCQGRIPMDPRFVGLTDWDMVSIAAGGPGRRVLEISGNAFYRPPEAEGWTTATLRPVPSSGSSSATPIIIGALGLLALLPFEEMFVAWLLGRRR